MTGSGLTGDLWLGGRLTLLQPAKGYRVAIDAALLAAAVPLRPGGRALELGAGVAAAALALAARIPDSRIEAVELQPELAALARRNIEANGFSGRVTARRADVLALDPALRDFDAVFFNPPYLTPDAYDAAPDPAKRIATVEGPARLADWMRTAERAARPGGDIVLIHRADRLADVLETAKAASVGGLIVHPLWPRAGAPAHRVIVHGRAGKQGPLVLSPGLVLHTADGAFTETAAAILAGGAALPPA